MRTSEQTYLAKLAFGDPDRKNELHDWTCQYLAQPDKARKLFHFVFRKNIEAAANARQEKTGDWPDRGSRWLSKEYLAKSKWTNEPPILVTDYGAVDPDYTESMIGAKLSQPIMGGYNNANIIGYLDVIVTGEMRFTRRVSRSVRMGDGEIAPAEHMLFPAQETLEERLEEALGLGDVKFGVGVEVKAGRVSLPAVLQQLETYRRHRPMPYVLCTLYRLPQADKELLEQHGYLSIYVSPQDVREFMAHRDSAQAEQESF